MKKALKIGGSACLGVAIIALLTLRITGLEPQYLDPTGPEFRANNLMSRPGLWLTGEVVATPVTDWDFVNHVNDPMRKNYIMVETHTRYFIPHSVTMGVVGRGNRLYVHAHSDEKRLAVPFPYDKAWTANVARDPRVRMKIAGKIYEMTLVLITDRAEVAAIAGRDPVERRKDPDGQERIVGVMHWYRAFQRNIPEYGSGQIAASRTNPS